MRSNSMSRLFGIAGIQMHVVAFDAQATVDKMAEMATNITKSFPWVQLIMFHELVVPGLDQFVTAENKEWLVQNSEAVPGTLSERLCTLARSLKLWLSPGLMDDVDGDRL